MSLRVVFGWERPHQMSHNKHLTLKGHNISYPGTDMRDRLCEAFAWNILLGFVGRKKRRRRKVGEGDESDLNWYFCAIREPRFILKVPLFYNALWILSQLQRIHREVVSCHTWFHRQLIVRLKYFKYRDRSYERALWCLSY